MRNILLVSLLLCSFGVAKADSLADATRVIPKFAVVDAEKVYRGSRPKTEDFKTLNALGVRTIIDLQGGDFDLFGYAIGNNEPGELPGFQTMERAAVTNLHMDWVSERLSSFTMTPQQKFNVEQALSIMHNPAMQPVFIHCEFGKDRTGLLSALYEVLFLNVSVNAAHARWVASGHNGGLDRTATIALDEYFYESMLTPNSELRTYFSH